MVGEEQPGRLSELSLTRIDQVDSVDQGNDLPRHFCLTQLVTPTALVN